MEMKSVFIPVPVEERLPEESGKYYTDGHRGKDFYKKGNVGFDDDADFWLEKKEGYFLSKDELRDFAEQARRYFINNTQHVPQADNAVYVMGSTDDFFNDWLNQQSTLISSPISK